MADISIIETDPEQGIAEYGYCNKKQFDLRAFYGDHLIASLWQDNEENWHWTKRLYDSGSVEDIDIKYLDDKSINGIIEDFFVRVTDWLNDEVSYLIDLANSINEVDTIIVAESN